MDSLRAGLHGSLGKSRLSADRWGTTLSFRRNKTTNRCSRYSAVSVRAFVPQLESKRLATFPRELEYSALLGLQGRETNLQETHIMSAFEHLASSPLEQGYSKQVEDGRVVLLHAAVDGCRNLKNLALRSDRHSIAFQEAKTAMVQWWLLPAALSLLQETQQSEAVLRLGREALSTREGQAHRRDILISMALAHCNLASSSIENKDQVRLACAHLEEALALLDQAKLLNGGSNKLAAEINEGLRQLKPDCVVEHLRYSEGEGQKGVRAQAIKVLKTLLANPELGVKEDGSTSVGREFVKQSLMSLTSMETVNLLDWKDIAKHGPAISWYFEGLLGRGALGHLVAGFVHRRPDLIEEAATLLAHPSNADMVLERVVCYMLLADTQSASQLLLEAEAGGYFQPKALMNGSSKEGDGQSAGGGSADKSVLPPRAEILAFIRKHSPNGDYDLLPGTIIFTERWFSKVAFESFKDTARSHPPASVNDYYEEERVTNYLSVRTRDNDSIRASIMVMSGNLKNSFQRILDAPVSTKGSRNHNVELPRLPVPGTYVQSAQDPKQRSWLKRIAGLSPLHGRQMATGVLLVGAIFVAGTVARRIEPAEAVNSPTTAILQEAEQQQDQDQQQQPSQLWQWRAPWQQQSHAPRLRQRSAEGCIRRWQAAKALALGPRHDESLLDGAIVEPYMSTICKDVAISRKAGWFWEYRLSDLYVENIENLEEETGGQAVVTARLREKGDLYAITGKRADAHCYDSNYRAEYTMVRLADNSWRISSVLVLGEGQ